MSKCIKRAQAWHKRMEDQNMARNHENVVNVKDFDQTAIPWHIRTRCQWRVGGPLCKCLNFQIYLYTQKKNVCNIDLLSWHFPIKTGWDRLTYPNHTQRFESRQLGGEPIDHFAITDLRKLGMFFQKPGCFKCRMIMDDVGRSGDLRALKGSHCTKNPPVFQVKRDGQTSPANEMYPHPAGKQGRAPDENQSWWRQNASPTLQFHELIHLHAAVARSTLANQNVQNTSAPKHFLYFRCREKLHAAVARSAFPTQNIKKLTVSEHFLKLRCRKIARRCGEKHINTCVLAHFLKFRCRKTSQLASSSVNQSVR